MIDTMSQYPTYKLGEVADYINGRAFKPSEWKEKGLPIVRIQNLNDESAVYHYSDAEHEEKYLLHDGDLLFAWAASLGTYIWNGGEAWLNQHIFKVLPKQNVSKMYLYYALTSIIKELYSKSHGSGMVHVTKGKFEETEIPLPPLATQRAIVTRIESLFAELDKGVEKLKTAQQQLKVYRQAVLNDCLTKGSEKWKKVKLGEVIERIEAGKSFRCSEKVPSKNEKGIVKISAVTWGEFLEMECKTIVNEEFYNPNYRIHKGDLLISRANTLQLVGSCVFVRKEPNRDIVLSDKVLRLIPKQNADSRFLLYSLRTSNSRKQIQTMSTGNQDSMRNIGQDRLKKINLECPSLPEQQRIVQEIETRLSACDEVEKNIAESLQQAEALRQSILKKAFSGELV
ncbi:MAG: restriction endonuclease subunit S [bacterium]|nr:restriction endonuclease subunit S [Candidatus Limimorpha caballi]